MSEIVAARTASSKTFDLGGGKRRYRHSLGPLHYETAGKFEDIDLTARVDAGEFLIDKAPFDLRVKPTVPAYFYRSPNGQVEVELTHLGGRPVAVKPAERVGKSFVWRGLALGADYGIDPSRKGLRAAIRLHDDTAPKRFTFRVAGDDSLLLPSVARDGRGLLCRLEPVTGPYDLEWTGEVVDLTRGGPRKRGRNAWTRTGVTYPVVFDPSINEPIAAGGDDGFEYPDTVLDLTSTVITLADFGGSPHTMGLRFQTLAIPAGATIDSATITVNITSGPFIGSPFTGTCYADDVDDAAAWSGNGAITGITKTTASAAISIGSSGSFVLTVTSILAEIVARGGWATGQDFRVTWFPTNTSLVYVEALENAGTAEAELDATYTEAGGGGDGTDMPWPVFDNPPDGGNSIVGF